MGLGVNLCGRRLAQRVAGQVGVKLVPAVGQAVPRPSLRAARDKSSIYSVGDVDMDFRCLPEACISTAAFVSFLFRMTKAGNKKKNEETRLSWALVAADLVKHCLPESFEVTVCTSRLWGLVLGLSAKKAWVRILVRSGVAHLGSATDGTGQPSLLIALAGNRATLSIIELVWAFDSKKSQWLLTQLVLEVGRNIEEFIQSRVTPAGMLELRRPADMSKAAKGRLTKLACKWVQRSEKDLKGPPLQVLLQRQALLQPLLQLAARG